MNDEFDEKSRTLKDKLSKVKLTIEQEEIIRIAMEFGYAAAFCERTADMNQSYSASERFKREYISLKKLVG